MIDGRRLNRTWLCSVLFSDLINYSSQSVSTQSEWKTFFNSSVANAIKAVVPEDRVIIDTGDGAAICFLGDPESAVLCSLAILNDFKERERADSNAPRIRLGVHLGPIKLVQDLNGNLNAIGDGINVGQRIMSFANGDQILVSRSYFEVVSRLSDEYSRIFKFEGMRQDKHVREHAIYALIPQFEFSNGEPGAATELISVMATPEQEPSPAFSAESLAVIEQYLRDLVGPVAAHLIRIESRRVRNLNELCEALAEKALPVTERERFLNVCRTGLKKANLQMETPAAAKGAVAAAEAGQPTPQQQNWDEAFCEGLKVRLAEHLGPVASIVVDRAARKSKTRDELLEALAEHFPPAPNKRR